jgi:hypothetical protein
MATSVNIQVAVRCRPMSSKEIQRGCKSVIDVKYNAIHILDVDGKAGSSAEKKDFTFPLL